MNNTNTANSTVKQMSIGKKIVAFPQFGILIVFIGLVIVLGCAAGRVFLTADNFINILRQTSAQLIVAAGMTFVLIMGGIDLSVGSIANLCGTLSAGFIVNAGMPMFPAILLAIGIGIGLGALNGIVIAKLNIQPFIMTLAMMSSAKGLALLYSSGKPISGLPTEYVEMGRGTVGVIPVISIIMIAVVVVLWLVLARSRFGRRIYATGGNEECARLSGINVDKIKIGTYVICAFCAALTGIVFTARVGSAQPASAEGLEMDAISAVVLGGTTLTGGKGYMLGTIIGAFFLIVLTNGFNIVGLSSYWQQVLKGIILVVAVVLYTKASKASM